MKRVLLFLLVVFMLLTALPATVIVTADGTDAKDAEDLPAAFTLVGTKHLPPISNQGTIGSCASSSITYMQFTNAVSRYLHSIDPDIKWDPSSGEAKYLFSPKFTYSFAGSGTEWVYRILMENGAPTQDISHFYTDSSGAYQIKDKTGKISSQTASWDVGEGIMEKAMGFRLTNFEQIWLRRDDNSFGIGGKMQITNNPKGKELLNKIKASLNAGNVVVTGGLSSCWYYANGAVVADTEFAKKGDNVMMCGRGDWVGGHQVCIVGYDDNVTAKVPNKNGGTTTLRGALLMANSWGTGYQNDGYVWIMYDALNEVSEYEELNFDDRKYPMDQFCFVDWRTDVTTAKPDLYIEVGVIAGDRSQMTLELQSRPIGATAGTFRTYPPYVFSYAGHRGDYDDLFNFTFTGETYSGKTAVGYFTFPLNQLALINNAGQLAYGVKLTSQNGDPVTLVSLKLKNNRGEVLAQSAPSGVVQGHSSGEFFMEGVKLVNSMNLPTVEGATVNCLSGTTYMKEGSNVSFTITPDDATKMAKVTLGDTELTPDENGVFTCKLYRDSKFTVEFIDKPAEPTDSPAGGNADGGSNTTVIIIVAVVAAVVVIGGAGAFLVIKKKK